MTHQRLRQSQLPAAARWRAVTSSGRASATPLLLPSAAPTVLCSSQGYFSASLTTETRCPLTGADGQHLAKWQWPSPRRWTTGALGGRWEMDCGVMDCVSVYGWLRIEGAIARGGGGGQGSQMDSVWLRLNVGNRGKWGTRFGPWSGLKVFFFSDCFVLGFCFFCFFLSF